MKTPEPPFWMDLPLEAPRPQLSRLQTQRHVVLYQWMAKVFLLFRGMTAVLALAILLILTFELSSYLGVLITVILSAAAVFGIAGYRRAGNSRNAVLEIQQRAFRQTGALQIGSAVHVAGHPALEREQEVVLALVQDRLNFYSYDNPHPVDNLLLMEIEQLHTVVYDDDRIPHIEAVDSTAQALQITYNHQGREYRCLFRRMRPVRPIDWFHHLQAARR